MTLQKPLNKIKIPERLKSRKFLGAVFVSLVLIGNSWFISGRPLNTAELSFLTVIWTGYAFNEAKVDAAREANNGCN